MLEITTARLCLRPLATSDLPALSEMLADPAVMQHSLRGVCDGVMVRHFLDWCFDCYIKHRTGPLALVDRHAGEFVGFCGVFAERVKGVTEWNLGYRLAKRHWGQGLATEAALASLEHAFEEKRFGSVIAIVEPAHSASQRVVEKAGFVGFDAIRFHKRPVRLFRLRRAQWLQRNTRDHAEAELATLSK